MAYVSTSWGRPIQGISQQPDRTRMEGQCTTQENFIPDVVKGLTRRTSTRQAASLGGVVSASTKHHSYDRGDEAYYMRVKPSTSTVEVFDLLGRPQVVNGSAAYVAHANPFDGLDMHTVGDFTFITNRDKPVTMSGELSPVPPKKGIIFASYAIYGKTYQVIVDGVVKASYTTSNGSDSDHVSAVKTDYVARRLYTEIVGGHIEGAGGVDQADFPGHPELQAELHDNVFYIWRTDGGDFSLRTADSQTGQDLKAIKGTIKSVSDLPPYAPEGYTLRITGEGKSTKDDYWVRAINTSDAKVNWRETVEPGIPVSFDASTMPHVLVRESVDGSGIATFTLRPGEWDKREVGGTDSNPLPSFINPDNPATIKAVGTFQNRLFFLSEESWYAGRSGLFFNFWRESGQVAVDTDPVEGYADTDQVNYLHNYQLLNGDLVLFSDKAQFIIKGDKPVTKANATVQQITAYPNNTRVTPQAAGENIFFAFNAAGYTGVRELFTDNYSDTKKAFPITDYVSKYVVGSANQLLASPNYNTLFIRTPNEPQSLWVYNWVWQADQKVQSAWHKWKFSGNLEYVFFREDKLYIISSIYGQTDMHYMYMINDPDEVELGYSACLDYKRVVTANYDPATDKWKAAAGLSGARFIPLTGYEYLVGMDLAYEGDAAGTVTFSDKLTERGESVQLLVGLPYTSTYVPTNPVVKDQRERVIGLDKIILQGIYLHYEVTGYIKVNVRPQNKPDRTYEFFGRYMGSDMNLIGSLRLEDGTYRVPVRDRADNLKFIISTDSPYPFTLRDMECNGTFHQRGQRI